MASVVPGLRRFAVVLPLPLGQDYVASLRFLCPATGYLTPKQKHVLQSQDFFWIK